MPDETHKNHNIKVIRQFPKALMLILMVLSVVFIAAFVVMNYFGERFIKTFLQAKILQTSQGIYKIDFDQFHFNLFSGKTTITNFQLIPNEERYLLLKEEGKIKGTLYAVNYKKLVLNSLDLKEMFLDRTIHLRMIEVEKPVISFIAFTDTISQRQGRFKHLYQDIYPLLSEVFREVKIDSIKVNDGSFSGKQTLESGKTIEEDWLYSAVLRDFDLYAYDHTEKRIFYSKEVELRIRNFSYSLSDSLYFLTADEVGFSLTGSRLFGKGLALTPNFLADKLNDTTDGNLYQVYLPEFSISGLDLYKAMLEKQISINSITIDNLDIRIFHHKPADPVVKKVRSEVTIANLYTIIQDKLKNITVDTFLLSNASFRLFSQLTEPRPEIQVNKATLELHGFLLDSIAHLDSTKIFYSREIEFDFEDFTLALQDKLHNLSAQKVVISTRRSLIEISNTRLYPSFGMDSTIRYKSNSIFRMMFPQVKLEQVNLLRMFNSRNLEFGRLAIFESDITIIQYQDKRVLQDSLIQKETFLHKLDLIRNLVIPYLVSMQAGTIEISDARIRFMDDKQGLNEERIAGLVDMTLTGFRMDTLTHYDRKEFLNRLELDLTLKDFRYLSPDSLHRVRIRELFVNSLLEELDINDFEMFTTSRLHPGMPSSSTLAIQFRSLQVQGFNHRKWIGKRWFSASDIRIQEPKIVIRSVKGTKESSLNEPFSEVDDAVSKIEIGSIRIDKGWFDLTEEDRKSKGSLLVRNVDFQLSKFLFDLTGWDRGEKILRYDILSIKPDTADAILLLDSAYLISFSRFLSDSYPPNFTIRNLSVVPVNPGKEKIQRLFSIELTLPSFIVRQLDLEQVLFNRVLRIEEISIVQPEITLHRDPYISDRKGPAKTAFSSQPELNTPFRSMEIGSVVLTDGIFHYENGVTEHSARMSLSRVNTTITGFRYNSFHPGNRVSSLFFCEDIDLQTGPYSMLSKDSMNTLSIAGMHFSTKNSTLALDSFAFTPNYSDHEYSRKLGYQADRIEINTAKIEMERLNFRALLEEQKIVAGLVVIDGLALDDYRDKRVEFPEWKRPSMIQQAIRKISFPMEIDTISLTNGKVTYREQNGDEPGMIFFDRMKVLAQNFTTDSLMISRGMEFTTSVSTYIMGKVKAKGEFRFPLQSPVDTFFFQGRADHVDMTLFNPMVSRITPVRIRNGVVDSVNIHWMRGNGIYASGLLDLYYHDLHVELQKEKKDFWNRIGTNLMQLVVDLAVPEENPGSFGIHRSGYIWNARNDEKGFFNFFWKSLFSGLKSSIGLNNKEQKAIKKEENLTGE